MAKCKWLTISSPLALGEISTQFAAHEFRRGGVQGVDLTEVEDDYIKARFIEESIETEVYIDPFGEEVRNEIRRHSIISFILFQSGSERHAVRIDDPPRTIKGFVKFMATICGFGFAISPLPVDVLAFTEEVKNFLKARDCRIRKIRAGNIQLSDSSIARLEVASKHDAYIDLKSQINLRGAVFEKATIHIDHADYAGAIEVSSTGCLSGEHDLIEKLTPLCIDYFRKQQSLNAPSI